MTGTFDMTVMTVMTVMTRITGMTGMKILMKEDRNCTGWKSFSKPDGVGSPLSKFHSEGIAGFDALAELALDMRWSWDRATDEVWRQLDPELWEITHNPLGCPADSFPRPDRTRLGQSRFLQRRRGAGSNQTARNGSPNVVSTTAFSIFLNKGRLFQHGIYAQRSLAHLLGWSGQCCG